MATRRSVDDAAWPHILHDLQRLGATSGEVRRVSEMVESGLDDVAFSLLEAALGRLRRGVCGC